MPKKGGKRKKNRTHDTKAAPEGATTLKTDGK
jgi:hypothetical protein